MRRTILIAGTVALAAIASTCSAMAAEGEPKTRTGVCIERAKAQKFGLHFIRRDRWIRECLKGKV